MSDTVLLQVANRGYSDGTFLCDACRQPILPKQYIFVLVREKYPFRCEDADDQDWEIFEWHKDCDPGTIAAENAEKHR